MTVQEVPPTEGADVFLNYDEDFTRWRDNAAAPGGIVYTALPNGRRGTAHIVTDSIDSRVRGDGGLTAGHSRLEALNVPSSVFP